MRYFLLGATWLLIVLVLGVGMRFTSTGKRIAVVGGGYAGLGTSFSLVHEGTAGLIDVFDASPPGFADASSISAGIIHPMATRGKIIWKGREGLEHAMRIMDAVNGHIDRPIYDSNVELYRFLFSETDLRSWSQSAVDLPEFVQMEDPSRLNSGLRTANSMPLLGVARIKQGAIVDSPVYLRAMWLAVQAHCPESKWVQQRVTPELLPELAQSYDEVVLACGAGIPRLCGMQRWPKFNKLSGLRLVRGQNLLFDCSQHFSEGGKQALLSGEYVVPRQLSAQDGEAPRVQLLCGPTHEHITVDHYEEELWVQGGKPDLAAAEAQVMARLVQRYPQLAGQRPRGAIAGTRLVTQRGELGRLPIVDRLPGYSNVWLHCGFGSRGLILHGLTSHYLAQAIAQGDDRVIPACLSVRSDKGISDPSNGRAVS